MDIRKLALYLSWKLPPYYGESNLYAFWNALKQISSEKYSREELLYISDLAKWDDEKVYFMVLDELRKQSVKDPSLKGKFLVLLEDLSVDDEIYATLKKDISCIHEWDDLLHDLWVISAGKNGAKQFEVFGERLLKYLFEDSFFDYTYF